jgi:hypothetical protein
LTHRLEDYDFHSPLTREVGGIPTCSFGSTFLPPKIHDIAIFLPHTAGDRFVEHLSPLRPGSFDSCKGRTNHREVTTAVKPVGSTTVDRIVFVFVFKHYHKQPARSLLHYPETYLSTWLTINCGIRLDRCFTWRSKNHSDGHLAWLIISVASINVIVVAIFVINGWSKQVDLGLEHETVSQRFR